MQVSLLETEGIPEGSILSVHAGSTNRQTPIIHGQAVDLHFPCSPSQGASIRVDVFTQTGSAVFRVQPGEERHMVELQAAPATECEGQDVGTCSGTPMRVVLDVKNVGLAMDHAREHVPSSPCSAQRPTASSTAIATSEAEPQDLRLRARLLLEAQTRAVPAQAGADSFRSRARMVFSEVVKRQRILNAESNAEQVHASENQFSHDLQEDKPRADSQSKPQPSGDPTWMVVVAEARERGDEPEEQILYPSQDKLQAESKAEPEQSPEPPKKVVEGTGTDADVAKPTLPQPHDEQGQFQKAPERSEDLEKAPASEDLEDFRAQTRAMLQNILSGNSDVAAPAPLSSPKISKSAGPSRASSSMGSKPADKDGSLSQAAKLGRQDAKETVENKPAATHPMMQIGESKAAKLRSSRSPKCSPKIKSTLPPVESVVHRGDSAMRGEPLSLITTLSSRSSLTTLTSSAVSPTSQAQLSTPGRLSRNPSTSGMLSRSLGDASAMSIDALGTVQPKKSQQKQLSRAGSLPCIKFNEVDAGGNNLDIMFPGDNGMRGLNGAQWRSLPSSKSSTSRDKMARDIFSKGSFLSGVVSLDAGNATEEAGQRKDDRRDVLFQGTRPIVPKLSLESLAEKIKEAQDKRKLECLQEQVEDIRSRLDPRDSKDLQVLPEMDKATGGEAAMAVMKAQLQKLVTLQATEKRIF